MSSWLLAAGPPAGDRGPLQERAGRAGHPGGTGARRPGNQGGEGLRVAPIAGSSSPGPPFLCRREGSPGRSGRQGGERASGKGSATPQEVS